MPNRRLIALGLAGVAALTACDPAAPEPPRASASGSQPGGSSAAPTDPSGTDPAATGAIANLPFGATPPGELAWTMLQRDPVDQEEFMQLDATQPQEQRWQSGNGCVLQLFADSLNSGAPRGDDQTVSRAMNKPIADLTAQRSHTRPGAPSTVNVDTGAEAAPTGGTVAFVASTITGPNATSVIATRTFQGKRIMQAVISCTGEGHQKAAKNSLASVRVVRK